jgi:peptidoglycan hydrolase FlgJ
MILPSGPLMPAVPPAGPSGTATDDIRKAAEGFEALFVASLLKGARAGLPGDTLTGGGGVQQMTGMLDSELARLSAGRTGLGLAEAVARQFAPDRRG